MTHPALHTQISGVDRVYLAPEILTGGATNDKVDIWSLGVMLYFLVTGGICENISEKVEMYFDEPQWDFYGEELSLFIEQCLEIDQNERPSVQVLLKHPFMQRQQEGKL